MSILALDGKVTSLQIKNRALQKLGVKRIVTETEVSKNASAVNACYDILRRAELRRHIWKFSIARAKILSSTDTDNMMFEEVAAFDDAVTTYDTGQLVFSEGEIWVCKLAVTAADGIPRLNTTDWTLWKLTHLGTVQDWDETTLFAVDDIVYYRGRYYIVVTTTTAALHPPTNLKTFYEDYRSEPQAVIWATADTYAIGDLVYLVEQDDVYSSRTAANSGNNPGSDATNWVRVGRGVGPEHPHNDPEWGRTFAFALPEDFIRATVVDPIYKYQKTEWIWEGLNILSDDAGPLNLRYCRDVTNVRRFDPLFVEALSSLIAFEVADELTNSRVKKSDLSEIYARYVSEAAQVDAIERGPTENEIDEFEAVRL